MTLPSYVCPACKAESYSAHDIAHRYCGRCHQFEDANPVVVVRMTAGEQRRIEDMLKGTKTASGLGPESLWVSEHPQGGKA